MMRVALEVREYDRPTIYCYVELDACNNILRYALKALRDEMKYWDGKKLLKVWVNGKPLNDPKTDIETRLTQGDKIKIYIPPDYGIDLWHVD